MSRAGEQNGGMLANRVAIITGSTAGIGLAIARQLGKDGAKVVVSSRKSKNVDEAVASLKSDGIDVTGTTCHVGIDADRKKLVDYTLQQYGQIDILVNNAAQNPHFGDLMDVSEKVWDKLFDTNVKAPFLLSKLCVPHLEKGGKGNIVFVSSITGYTPFPAISAYGVTKTTLLGLTKAMATSCAQRNIRVNCIAPGIIKTDFSRALWENDDGDMMRNMIPLQRYGNAEDCAGIVSFLCSDKASYITGETVVITGGINARL